MDFSIYIAFLPAQWNKMHTLRKRAAWLGCRLSPYGDGITGLPPALPEKSMLILTDETPPQGHDPERVARELTENAMILGADRILLDFQRDNLQENRDIAKMVLRYSEIPVGITEQYGKDLDCPVFLSPPPLWTPLEEKAAAWAGRELWLEAVTESALVTVTQKGSRYEPGDFPLPEDSPVHERLCLRYRMERSERQQRFTLSRDAGMVRKLLKQAEGLGFTVGVGLFESIDPLGF